MKVILSRSEFVKSWNLAERSAAPSGSINIFSTIRIIAKEDITYMHATDIKTSIICRAEGVTVVEPGEAVIPLKGASDLFKKAGSPELELEISECKAVMKSGKSRYRFTTYPVSDFPKLPSSDQAELFCSTAASDLVTVIDRGSLCASTGDEYPQYLSSALFELKGDVLSVVSTDKRRLALAKCGTSESAEAVESLLLPVKGLRELVRILSMLDGGTVIKISYDDSQVYFATDGMEFALRRVDSKFPAYERILPESHTTEAVFDRQELMASLERVDIVVRDYNRVVVINLSKDGEDTMSGRSPDFGEAEESISCQVEGDPVVIGFNTRFFYEAVKILNCQKISLNFNGNDGHMLIKDAGSDSFLCLIAPVDIGEEDHGSSSDDDTGDAY